MKTYQFGVESHPTNGWQVVSDDGQTLRVCITDPSYHLCLKVAYQMNQLVASLAKAPAPILDEPPQASPAAPNGGGNRVPLAPVPPAPPSPIALVEPSSGLDVPDFLARASAGPLETAKLARQPGPVEQAYHGLARQDSKAWSDLRAMPVQRVDIAF